MTNLELLVTVSTVLEFNPLFQAIKSVHQKKVEDVSVLTFLSIMIIGILWLVYGISIQNIPLIIGNSIKLFSSLMVVIIWWKYKKEVV